ncbi:MAG: hypothetical protein K9H25_18730 [Rhodospirillum sp.]|nr:hypothetical protein [Rhodospirillum sp.]MCF8489743.1 hypothetical protein [Rhodospirillum sp.]
MDFKGSGILALWNGAEPARSREYNLWHSREHVPERLSVPGMRSARRYVRTGGELPEYLTLYEMTDVSVLSSPPYLRLLNHPTEWSGSMRPSFQGFMRICCTRLATQGGGLGSSLAAMVVEDGIDLNAPELTGIIDWIVSSPGGIVAAHIIRKDPEVPAVPFQMNGANPKPSVQGALLFEGFDESDVVEELERFAPCFAQINMAGAMASVTYYSFAYALTSESLGRVVPLSVADFRGTPQENMSFAMAAKTDQEH